MQIRSRREKQTKIVILFSAWTGPTNFLTVFIKKINSLINSIYEYFLNIILSKDVSFS